MPYRIIPHYGHFQAYINEKFFCSADTFSEAMEEVENFCK